LAGLFWALLGEDQIIAQLIRKVLYVGFFALLIGNFKNLADIVFTSFAGLGLKASGGALTPADLMRPGFLAATGFAAARPLLEAAGELVGITAFFANFITISVLLLAWLIVLIAFFVMSVQLFITIIEFKLTVLAGFVLVPFALFGHTTFLAERVLGNVIASGLKLMVLAIVVGIGASLFGTLIRPAADITLNQAAATMLAAIAVFGLAVFVPALAAGLISGAPGRPSPPRPPSAAPPSPGVCWRQAPPVSVAAPPAARFKLPPPLPDGWAPPTSPAVPAVSPARRSPPRRRAR
jgi:type IV secretion system protein TrbL